MTQGEFSNGLRILVNIDAAEFPGPLMVFMSAPDTVARVLGPQLDEICQKLDDLSDAIGVLQARMHLIDANASRKSKIWDAAYHGGPT